MAELFERHDRSRFDVFAYSYGPDDKSEMRQRLIKGFRTFLPISARLGFAAAARRIYDDGHRYSGRSEGLYGRRADGDPWSTGRRRSR